MVTVVMATDTTAITAVVLSVVPAADADKRIAVAMAMEVQDTPNTVIKNDEQYIYLYLYITRSMIPTNQKKYTVPFQRGTQSINQSCFLLYTETDTYYVHPIHIYKKVALMNRERG